MRNAELTGGVVDPIDADRGEADGCCELVTEEGCSGVTDVGVDELARDDLVAVEGCTVGGVCPAYAGIAGGIVPAAFTEAFFG